MLVAMMTVLALAAGSAVAQKRPNIVMLMGDDIGWNDFGAYSGGGAALGHPTPNVDRIAREGAMFTSWYRQASCTAGRASFMTGRIPIRSALSIVVAPGDENALRKETPTSGATSISGGDPDRAKAIHMTLRTKQWFPSSFAEVYNVGGGAGNAVSLLELIEKIKELAGYRLEYRLEARRPGDQLVYLTDYSKLYQHSGWKPEIDLSATLEMLRQFWEENEGAQKSRQPAAPGPSPPGALQGAAPAGHGGRQNELQWPPLARDPGGMERAGAAGPAGPA